MARITLPDPPADVAAEMIEEAAWVLRQNVAAGRLPRAETKMITDELDALQPRLRNLTNPK